MQPNSGANGQPTCETRLLPSASTQKGAEVPAHSLSGVLLGQACARCRGSTTEFDQLAGLREPVAELGEETSEQTALQWPTGRSPWALTGLQGREPGSSPGIPGGALHAWSMGVM